MKYLALVLAGSVCGCLPPDSSPQKPAAQTDPAAASWVVENHIIGDRSAITETDANAMHGRKIVIDTHGFKSPWHGSCDEATREEHRRTLSQISNDIDLSEDRGNKILRFGIRDPITEIRFLCRDSSQTAPLTMYISGDRAITCFASVCYLLSR